jgi:hypothetical protein
MTTTWFRTFSPRARSRPPYGIPNISPWSWKTGNRSGNREKIPVASLSLVGGCQPVSFTNR